MEKLAHIGKQLGAAFFEKALRDLFLVGLADSGACVRGLLRLSAGAVTRFARQNHDHQTTSMHHSLHE